jgi:hypothetical protein
MRTSVRRTNSDAAAHRLTGISAAQIYRQGADLYSAGKASILLEADDERSVKRRIDGVLLIIDLIAGNKGN